MYDYIAMGLLYEEDNSSLSTCRFIDAQEPSISEFFEDFMCGERSCFLPFINVWVYLCIYDLKCNKNTLTLLLSLRYIKVAGIMHFEVL